MIQVQMAQMVQQKLTYHFTRYTLPKNGAKWQKVPTGNSTPPVVASKTLRRL
jgi:hypothetical protein